MKQTIYITISLLIILSSSCKKEEISNNTNPSDLNGNWIEGSWTKKYADRDSILANGNWVVKDTIEDPSANTSWVHWQEPNDSLTTLTTNTSNNEASIYWNYVGDGYNNNPSVINVMGNNYQNGDTISTLNSQYVILDFTNEGNGLDAIYRYHVEAKIVNSFNGGKEYIELFKRQDD